MTQALETSPAECLDIFDAMSTAVLVFDRDLAVILINAAAQLMLGTSVAKLHQMALSEQPASIRNLRQAASRALNDECPYTERGLNLAINASDQIIVDCSITPLWRLSADPEQVIVEMTSIDHRQRIQLEGDMLAQNNATSALLSGLAHEIKNPLGGIRGAAQLLEHELEDQRQAEYTQVIISEADRLRTLVDRMLGPRGESKRALLNVHEILEHVRLVAAADCSGYADIERDYDPSLPEVFVDRDELVQALLNLVRNAVQAIKGRGGKVTLKTRAQRQFTLASKLHRVVIRVDIIDDGPGVDPELGNSIFFPMVSGHAEGTGLGLPIAQSLIHRQGGLVGFESQPGLTQFSVWLPVGEQADG